MAPLNKMSHLEMLHDQLIRCDEEIYIFLKRRFQTAKKMAEQVTKKGESIENLNSMMDDIHFKSMVKSREMGFDMNFTTRLLEILDEETKKVQKEVLEK